MDPLIPANQEAASMSSHSLTVKKARAPRISQRKWEKHREHIEELYVKQGKSLEKVAATLSQRHGFEAQKCQYKAQIARWGFRKNSRPNQDYGERWLSMVLSKEQQEYWASQGRVLMSIMHLGYESLMENLVLQCAVRNHT
jgi:hypothetical protein